MKKFPLKRGDYLVVFTILLLSVLFFLVIFLPKSNKNYCIIQQERAIIKLIPLDENTTVTVEGDYQATIQVQDGAVAMIHSTCPNQNCVHQGQIHRAGESIVCLPNQLVIAIQGKPSETEVDVIVP